MANYFKLLGFPCPRLKSAEPQSSPPDWGSIKIKGPNLVPKYGSLCNDAHQKDPYAETTKSSDPRLDETTRRMGQRQVWSELIETRDQVVHLGLFVMRMYELYTSCICDVAKVCLYVYMCVNVYVHIYI